MLTTHTWSITNLHQLDFAYCNIGFNACSLHLMPASLISLHLCLLSVTLTGHINVCDADQAHTEICCRHRRGALVVIPAKQGVNDSVKHCSRLMPQVQHHSLSQVKSKFVCSDPAALCGLRVSPR